MILQDRFSDFAIKSKTKLHVSTKLAVSYTRVSSKEQADKNLSLETQKRAIEDYASRNGITILAQFGGTYESAKTDGRKEFQRMQEYVGKNKAKLEYILVYTLDRFSRTGGAAIKLAQDLREKLGVRVFAVTQPTDTNNPSGILHQNIQLLFSHFDNQLRSQKSVAGMREKFNRGEWIVRVPRGFDIIRANGERKIIINKEAESIKRAFELKATGVSNGDIIQTLKSRGFFVSKQQLCKIFSNPFYCGKIAHAMLDGKVIDGNQELLISEDLFLKVNHVRQLASGYGISHRKREEKLPLKLFLTCGNCGAPLTGYVVQKKGLYYYKCRTTGCNCNRSASKLHVLFSKMLEKYQLKDSLVPLLEKQLTMIHKQFNSAKLGIMEELNVRYAKQKNIIEALEEKFYLHESMSSEVFERLHNKSKSELLEIVKEMSHSQKTISNPVNALKKALQISSKLASAWNSGNIDVKEKLQNLVFPEGINFHKENDEFRTKRTNSIFDLIALLSSDLSKKSKGAKLAYATLSLSAEREGFEPPEV